MWKNTFVQLLGHILSENIFWDFLEKHLYRVRINKLISFNILWDLGNLKADFSWFITEFVEHGPKSSLLFDLYVLPLLVIEGLQ